MAAVPAKAPGAARLSLSGLVGRCWYRFVHSRARLKAHRPLWLPRPALPRFSSYPEYLRLQPHLALREVCRGCDGPVKGLRLGV